MQQGSGRFFKKMNKINLGRMRIIAAQHPASGIENRQPDKRKRPRISCRRPQSAGKNIAAYNPGRKSRQQQMKTHKRRKGYRNAASHSRGNGTGRSRHPPQPQQQIAAVGLPAFLRPQPAFKLCRP